MSVELIDKIKPKNNGTFPLVDAEDVLMPSGERLDKHVHSWDSLQNKPFYNELQNGSGTFSTAPEVFGVIMADTLCTAYKVSDLVPTNEETMRTTFGVELDDGSWLDRIPSEDEVMVGIDDLTMFRFATEPTHGFVVVRTVETIAFEYAGVSFTYTFPETGIYFMHEYETEWVEQSFTFSYGEVKKIDPIFIPKSDSYLPVINDGDNGKVVTVENGQFVLAEPVGGSTTCIFPEQIVSGFAYSNAYGYMCNILTSFEIVLGETYKILWDDTVYTVVAEDASSFSEDTILLGNGTPVGLSGNGEPFAIGWSATGVSLFAFEDPWISHTLAIYKVVGNPASGLPSVTTNDNNKILQVVNGKWEILAIADSAVRTYIDNYINEALGGDY